MAETAPDQLVYVDRRNNVLKLSQGEFVTVSNLEAVLRRRPLVRQIFVYGNSERSSLLAVIVPTDEALASDDADGGDGTRDSLQERARDRGAAVLRGARRLPHRDHTFHARNGLLSGIRKLARPKLKELYGERLEQLYAELATVRPTNCGRLRAEEPTGRCSRPSLGRRALLGAAGAESQPTCTSPTSAETRCRR